MIERGTAELATARRFAVGSGKGCPREVVGRRKQDAKPSWKMSWTPFCQLASLDLPRRSSVDSSFKRNLGRWGLHVAPAGFNSDVPCDRPPLGVAPLNGRAPSDGERMGVGALCRDVGKSIPPSPPRCPRPDQTPPPPSIRCRAEATLHDTAGPDNGRTGTRHQAPSFGSLPSPTPIIP